MIRTNQTQLLARGLAAAVLGVSISSFWVSCLAHADSAPRVPPVAAPSLGEPVPDSVRHGITELNKACSAWLPVDAHRLLMTQPVEVRAPEANVCRFVLDAKSQEWTYMLDGVIAVIALAIPGGLIVGAFWVALGMGARCCRRYADWLWFRLSRA